MTTITALPKTRKWDGFVYTQLWREGNLAIYRQAKPDSEQERFEVIRIIVRPAHSIGGRDYPKGERHPKSSEWGRHGWSFMTLPEARKHAYSLVP